MNKITKKQFDEYKNKLFMLYVFYDHGYYYTTIENITIIQAFENQLNYHLQNKHCIIIPMQYHHRLPMVSPNPKLDHYTYQFKLAILPLLFTEPYNQHLTWEDVEEFAIINGYTKQRIDYRKLIELKLEDN